LSDLEEQEGTGQEETDIFSEKRQETWGGGRQVNGRTGGEAKEKMTVTGTTLRD